MPAPVSDDPEEIRASALFSRLVKAGGWTHEQFADEVGVSSSRVSQWATNRGGIPPERALTVAAKLNVRPELISVSWRRLRDEFLKSQEERLTPEIVAAAIHHVRLGTGIAEGKAINVEDDLVLFAQALRVAIAKAMKADEMVTENELGNRDGAVLRAVGAPSGTKARKESKPKGRRTRQPAKRAARGAPSK